MFVGLRMDGFILNPITVIIFKINPIHKIWNWLISLFLRSLIAAIAVWLLDWIWLLSVLARESKSNQSSTTSNSNWAAIQTSLIKWNLIHQSSSRHRSLKCSSNSLILLALLAAWFKFNSSLIELKSAVCLLMPPAINLISISVNFRSLTEMN